MSATITPEQRAALNAVADAICEAVRATGAHGAPGGHIYAGLMSSGCTLSQYTSIMGILVRNGRLRREGELYFPG